MQFLARIYVTLKPTVNDPQGNTVRDALHSLGYAEVSSVRMGKYMEIGLTAGTDLEARKRVNEMCDRLLANPVIERYRFDLEELAEEAAQRA